METFACRTTALAGLMVLATSHAGVPARAQDPVLLMPVFSIEAFEVNSVPITNGPASKITVAPGDVITAKIMIRNWSPQGQPLRGYQATLDAAGFKSGTTGTIQPVGYQPGTNNEANAFIDLKDPAFIHKGHGSVPLVDSASENYRWLNVLLDEKNSPVAAQDGKKYYCATVKLRPSDDATGIFKLSLMEENMASGLLDPANEPILPVGSEPLHIEVKSGVKWLKIESSDPPNGAVDGRIELSAAGKQDNVWGTVILQFNADVGEVTAADFEVIDGSPTPPKITGVEVSDAQVLITLDKGIRSGAWTTIKHKGSDSFTRIGRLSGDVNNDGRTNADDLMELIRKLNGGIKLPLYQADLDADGKVTTRDALRLIDLLTQKRPPKQSRLR